jgi:hypothetical protein
VVLCGHIFGAGFFPLFSTLFSTAGLVGWGGVAVLRALMEIGWGEAFLISCEKMIWEDNGVHTTTGGFRSCAQIVCS